MAWMLDGWLYAHRRRNRPPTMGDVLKLGLLVEPRHNSGFGFREVDVRVGFDRKVSWERVNDAMDSLVKNQPPFPEATEQEATEWFRQYEEIHPFRDGNGRTGSLLYNWLRRSLPEPIHPPNLWNDPRRRTPNYPHPLS